MADMRPLYKFIGDPIVIVAPSATSTDGINASDCAAGVPVEGAAGVMLLMATGTWTSNSAHTVTAVYSSTGLASNAASSAAGWTMSDAAYSAFDTDGVGDTDTLPSNACFIMDIDLSKKGITDENGKIFIDIAAGETGGMISSVIGIPYFGNKMLPCTNAQTVIEATA
jgi:hypothetical protein